MSLCEDPTHPSIVSEDPATSVIAGTSSSPISEIGSTSSSPIWEIGSTSFSPISQICSTSSSPISQIGSTSASPILEIGSTSSSPISKIGSTSFSPISQIGSTSSSLISQICSTSSSPVSQIGSTSFSPILEIGSTSSSPIIADNPVLGKGTRGRARAVDPGVSLSFIKYFSHMVNKIVDLNLQISANDSEVEKLKKEMAQLKDYVTKEMAKFVHERVVVYHSANPSTSSSSMHPCEDVMDIGKKCEVYGWGNNLVVYGEVIEVNPKLQVM